MNVLELATRCSVAPHVVRYYTRTGLLSPVCNPHNGYKMYSDSDLARLRFVRQAQSLGFTLKEIGRIFQKVGRNDSPCSLVREIIRRRIEENREKMKDLTDLQTRMEQALALWSRMPDDVPDGNTMCHLIESIQLGIRERGAHLGKSLLPRGPK